MTDFNIEYLKLLLDLKKHFTDIFMTYTTNELYPIKYIEYDTNNEYLEDVVNDINKFIKCTNNIGTGIETHQNISLHCLYILNILINVYDKVYTIKNSYHNDDSIDPRLKEFLEQLEQVLNTRDYNLRYNLKVLNKLKTKQIAGNPKLYERLNINSMHEILSALIHTIYLVFMHYETNEEYLNGIDNDFILEATLTILYYVVCIDKIIINKHLLDNDENFSLLYVETDSINVQYIIQKIKELMPDVLNKLEQ